MKFYAFLVCLGAAAALMPSAPGRNTFAQLSNADIMAQLNRFQAAQAQKQQPSRPAVTTAPAQRKRVCGMRSLDTGDRIMTASEDADVEYLEFVWTTAVINMDNNSYHCVGSLIHPQVVLSVAHRFDRPGRWSVRVGEHYLKRDTEMFEVINITVREVVMHPRYNPNSLIYDIALLILDTPVPASDHIGTICLPPPQSETPPGTRCIVTGWGHEKWEGGTESDALKMIELPIVENRQCARALRKAYNSVTFNLHKTQMCAGGEKDRDACRRDGGAALACPYATDDNRYYQAGIVAFGSGCGKEGVPAGYTNVAELRSWIDENMISRGYNTETYTFTP